MHETFSRVRLLFDPSYISIGNSINIDRHTDADDFGDRFEGLKKRTDFERGFSPSSWRTYVAYVATHVARSFCSRRADRFEGSCNIVLHRNRTKRSGFGPGGLRPSPLDAGGGTGGWVETRNPRARINSCSALSTIRAGKSTIHRLVHGCTATRRDG